MFEWLGNWWNGVELWLTQLWFPFQFATVLVVLVPLFLGVSWVLNRVVDRLAAKVTRTDDAQPPVASADGRS